MNYPWAFAGNKVVCIDDTFNSVDGKRIGWWFRMTHSFPIEGQTYTITAVFPPKKTKRPCPFIALAGFNAKHTWAASQFRPLTDTSGTVEEMRKLMRDASKTKKVDA